MIYPRDDSCSLSRASWTQRPPTEDILGFFHEGRTDGRKEGSSSQCRELPCKSVLPAVAM